MKAYVTTEALQRRLGSVGGRTRTMGIHIRPETPSRWSEEVRAACLWGELDRTPQMVCACGGELLAFTKIDRCEKREMGEVVLLVSLPAWWIGMRLTMDLVCR